MTDKELPADRLSRILNGIETIEESLGVLARKQRVSRDEYELLAAVAAILARHSNDEIVRAVASRRQS